MSSQSSATMIRESDPDSDWSDGSESDLQESMQNSLFTNLKRDRVHLMYISRDMYDLDRLFDRVRRRLDSVDAGFTKETELHSNALNMHRKLKLEFQELRLLSEEFGRKVKDIGQTLRDSIKCCPSIEPSRKLLTNILHRVYDASEISKLFESSISLPSVYRPLILPYMDPQGQGKPEAYMTISRPQKSTESLLQTPEVEPLGFQDTQGTS